MAFVAVLLPLVDHYLGQLFGKNSGWHALGVVLFALDFKFILNVAVGSVPALLLLCWLTGHVVSVGGHLSTIELYLARIAMQQSGATRLEVVSTPEGVRGTVISTGEVPTIPDPRGPKRE